MKIVVLSHFDQKLGPRTFLCIPEDVSKDTLAQIADLINLYQKKEFFIHNVKGLKSANQLFEISNPKARGGHEVLLVSALITEGDIDTEVSKDMLAKFYDEMRGIKDVHKVFNAYGGEDKTPMNELKSLFTNFYNAFPVEEVVQNRKDAKIFVFGLSKAGKTTIIRQLKNNKNLDTLPTINVATSRVFLNNMSMFVYDSPGQAKFRPLWAPYLKSQDAMVFVFDVTDKDNYKNARDLLHEVANMESVKGLPLLILLNKVDVESPDLDQIKTILDLSNLQVKIHKIFLTSATTNKGVVESFNWLSSELLKHRDFIEQPVQTTEMSDCVIFSRWDEVQGIEILSVYPEDRVSDPELIAIRCLSIAEFIFGGESFSKKVSIIVPISHLKVKAAIYFDFINDSKVRGGKLPLSLVALFEEGTPDATIDATKVQVLKLFEKMKLAIKDRNELRKILTEIYEYVFKRGSQNVPKGKGSDKKGLSKNFEDFAMKF